MKNNTFNGQNCCCPHCEAELKNGCLSPEFCTPCYISRKNNGIKMCPVCKSEYAYEEYSECPVCSVQKKIVCL
jgi:hypothetical protein